MAIGLPSVAFTGDDAHAHDRLVEEIRRESMTCFVNRYAIALLLWSWRRFRRRPPPLRLLGQQCDRALALARGLLLLELPIALNDGLIHRDTLHGVFGTSFCALAHIFMCELQTPYGVIDARRWTHLGMRWKLGER